MNKINKKIKQTTNHLSQLLFFFLNILRYAISKKITKNYQLLEPHQPHHHPLENHQNENEDQDENQLRLL